MHKYSIISILLPLLLYCACSNRPATNPVTLPETEAETLLGNNTTGNRVLWGLWQFRGDTQTEEFDIIPLRHGMIHLNALVFLEPPANILLRVMNLSFSPGQIDVDIQLTHPFLGKTEYTAFDVKGILITPANDNSYP